MLVSVIAPAYNEEKLLPSFLKEVTEYLEKGGFNYEVIIVENGSQDKTLAVARVFSQKNKSVRVEHLTKAGYGRALICGFKKAKGDFIVVYNVDFWDKRFLDLVKVDLLGYDLVTGSKNLPGSFDKRSFSRKLVTKSFALFLRLLLGYKGTDTHGIKTLRSSKINPILKKCRTETGIFDSELLVRSQRAGLKILELPVEISEKRANRFGIKRILETPKDILKLYLALRF